MFNYSENVHLTLKLFCLFHYQSETRAEFAEKSVVKLEKNIDELEGEFIFSNRLVDTCFVFTSRMNAY